jgi:hypothetical protein
MKESISELLWLVKTSLSTFWFWLPILIALCGAVEMWMFVFIHPMTIFILPAIVAAYALFIEDRRIKGRYRAFGAKHGGEPFPIGATLEFTPNWDAKQRVDEYLRVLEDEKQSENSRN